MNEDMGQLQGLAPAIEVSPTLVSPAPEIRLKVAVVEKLNLADFQNAVPALHELAIVNEMLASFSELTITITSEPAFLKPRTWSIDTVGAGETFHIADLDVQLDGSLLSRLTEAEPATLYFELRSSREPETTITQHEHVVELLARNQWGGIGYAAEMVAAFVQPNDPMTRRSTTYSRLLPKLCRQAASQPPSMVIPMALNAPGNWPPASGLPFYNANSTMPCRQPALSTEARRYEALGKFLMLAWLHA